jgi:hypothetical protein
MHAKDEDTGRREGMCQMLADVREAGLPYEYEEQRVRTIHR